MSVLVDYSCARCGGPHEAWVSRPVPPERPCAVCGSAARRRFGGALLRAVPTPAPVPPARPAVSCQDYPMVPGLCHMTPSAARSWVARARRDGRALDRELAYQESAATHELLDTSAAPIGHDHSPGHHDHSGSHHHSGMGGRSEPVGPKPTPAAND